MSKNKKLLLVALVIFFAAFSLISIKRNAPRTSARVKTEGTTVVDRYGNFVTESSGPYSEGLKVVFKDERDPQLNRKVRKFGYEDKKGRIVIDCQFAVAAPFSEGMAAVKKDAKWGYIDKKGQWVISPVYNQAKGFSEGLAAVKIGDKWGYINTKAEKMIEPKFGTAYDFLNDKARITENKENSLEVDSYYIDKQGNRIYSE